MHDQAIDSLPKELTSTFELLYYTSFHGDSLLAKFLALLMATKDHLDTVRLSKGSYQDEFLRLVQWILKLKCVQELILISPHEAQA